MANSYQASNLGLQEIDSARSELGWNKTDDRWLDAAEVSRSTLNRFLNGQKIKHETFVNICKAVGIENWRRIRQTEVPKAAIDLMIALPPESLENLAEQMRRWFGALRFEIEQELEQTEDYFQWIIRIPARGRFDCILLRGMTREIDFLDLHQIRGAINTHQPDETWLVTDFQVNPAMAAKAKEQGYPLLCMTFDELIDQDVDFSPYIKWLVEQVEGQEIDERYIQLGCKRSEIDPETQDYLGTHPYPAKINNGLEGYIDGWLEAKEKYHVSVLGESGTGKTWLTLHYAWRELQKYLKAKETQCKRPRLPLLVPLKGFATKNVDLEHLLADFFFTKHQIPLNIEMFDRLNAMGKLLLIFDGFDEISDKTSMEEIGDNFWQLAQILGSKVILTSRREHYPGDGNAQMLFKSSIPENQGRRFVAPQLEVVELEPFDVNL